MDKLSLVKAALNHAAVGLRKLAPRPEPRRPISVLTVRLFDFLREAAKMAPGRFYQDGNWPRILDVTEKVLVYVAEEDGHYAGQLSQAFLLIHDLVHESRRMFPPGSQGDVAWMQWASQQGITAVKPAGE